MLVRVWHLTSFEYWTDELHTLSIARTGEYSFGPAYRLAPLNFMLTSWSLNVLGDNELGGRLVPLLAGLLTVIATFVVAKRWFGTRAAVAGTLFLSLSAWHVYWSQNARHFSLETLCVLVAVHGFLLFWKENRVSGLGLMILSAAAALAVHSSAAFYVVAFGAFIGLRAVYDGLRARNARAATSRKNLMALGAVGLLLAAYVPVAMSIGSYLVNKAQPWNPIVNLVGSLVFYVPPYVIMAAAAGAAWLAYEGDDSAWLFVALIVVPVAELIVASRSTIASAAYVLPSLPPAAIIAGVAVDRLLRVNMQPSWRVAALLLAAGLYGGQLWDLALYHTEYRGLKPRWREAAEYVRANARPGEVLVAAEADVLGHYLQRPDVKWYGNVEQEIVASTFPPADAKGVWYVIYTADEPLVRDARSARARIVGAKQLKALLPLHYGPKDRTLGVFYDPLGQ